MKPYGACGIHQGMGGGFEEECDNVFRGREKKRWFAVKCKSSFTMTPFTRHSVVIDLSQ